MSAPTVEIEAITAPVYLGEGPFWSVNEDALYYVDIFEQDVHRFHPSSGLHTKLHIEGGPVTFVLPHQKPHKLVISLGRKIAAVTWPNVEENYTAKTVQDLCVVEEDSPENRFNDAKCDLQGRLWAGTMGNTDLPDNLQPDRGNLYVLNTDCNVSNALNKVSLSNGLAWNDQRKKFYFVDSCAYAVYEFDYCAEKAALSNKRVIIDYRKSGLFPAFPDGMAIDRSGNLWIASLGSGKIHCVNPSSGEIERCVELPTTNVTSVCWGGKQLDELYVTSAKKALSERELKKQHLAGSVFRIRGLGTSGTPSRYCKINHPFFGAK